MTSGSRLIAAVLTTPEGQSAQYIRRALKSRAMNPRAADFVSSSSSPPLRLARFTPTASVKYIFPPATSSAIPSGSSPKSSNTICASEPFRFALQITLAKVSVQYIFPPAASSARPSAKPAGWNCSASSSPPSKAARSTPVPPWAKKALK